MAVSGKRIPAGHIVEAEKADEEAFMSLCRLGICESLDAPVPDKEPEPRKKSKKAKKAEAK